jgi:hypothetical protein
MSQAVPRSGIRREPIFWLTTSEHSNGNGERTRVRMINGRKVTEKVPQIGHDGSCDYENKVRARGTRYMMVIRHEGHEIPLMLTNAAAHLDASGPYGGYMRRKARFLGWYPSGTCPCALRAAGELRDDHIVSDEVRQAHARGESCPDQANMAKPCKHDIAEREARRKQWAVDHAEKMSAYKTDAEKLNAEQRAMNGELLKDMAVQVAKIIAESQAAAQAATTKPPEKTTK